MFVLAQAELRLARLIVLTTSPKLWLTIFFVVFVFFLISKFKNQNRFVDDDDSDDDNDDDDDRKKSTKSKCVSNDRSGHDDQNEYRIIKIGAILEG